ncbi:MAG: M23 family metallopeptidase [candidate division WOR-3 bacterium]|nr:MAG: M23 family metallopeptidase [candidate division WOR-3 bacterium]
MNGLKNISTANCKILILMVLVLIACQTKKNVTQEPQVHNMHRLVKKGQTLELVLEEMISPDHAFNVISALKSAGFPFRRCIPGDTVRVVLCDDELVTFSYTRSYTEVYYLARCDDFYTVAMKYPYIDTTHYLLSGEISSTLYETVLELGETPNLVYRFADVFAWEIDFVTETQNGDSFYVYIEKTYCDSQFIGYGNIIMTRYTGHVGDYYGIYFCDPEGHEDYYNLKGESLRKSLLKSPLRFSYISSYFSKKRFHPILKVWRPHHGLDYSAPTGTPVASIGAGVVTYKGWKGGYGNLVEIKHMNNFRTRYGHLSKFVKGLYKGKHVTMGELIGYVGSTGLSTGPHLHFELHKNGAPINPLKVNLPRAPAVKKKYLADYEQLRDSLIQHVEELLIPGSEGPPEV